MTLARTTFAAVIVAALSALGAKAEAASYEHIDTLALRLQNQSSTLYWEFRNHFSHAAHADHLLSDTADMYRLAKHIHEVAHFGSGLNHIAADLDKLDRQFHHLEDLVSHINEDAAFGGGHVHGNTWHVRRLMRQMENTLHHLRQDVNEMRAPVYDPHHGHGHGVHGAGYGGYGGYGGGYGGGVYKSGGISFGGGGIKIKF